MEYTELSNGSNKIVVRITSVNAEELLGREIGKLSKQGYQVIAELKKDGFTFARELETLGITSETLSQAWGIDGTLIQRVAEIDSDGLASDEVELTAEVTKPLTDLVLQSLRMSENPKECARFQIWKLTSGVHGDPILPMSTLALYGDVETARLEAFAQGEDTLNDEEAARLSIALLIADRALNDRPRREQVFRPSET